MTMPPQPDFLCRKPASPFPEAVRSAEAQPALIPEPRPPSYRPDIDGLRALAVLAVVFFHAGVPGFNGGYVGVDIFFVISGYLITRLLAESAVSSAGLWLRTFYVRRGRRILPALLITSAVAALAATVLLLPWDLLDFGKFLAASSAFLSNLAAWNQGDYFNTARSVPILHFWSLAVEEQFYLAYPLVLLLLARYLPRHRLLALIALAAISFAACVWASYEKPRSNFFLAPTRAWELLLGAIVAFAERQWHLPRAARELLAALAGVILIVAIGLYDSQLHYPGVATLAPCVATAILIATHGVPITLVGKLLQQRPLVFTGLVSYSLYLWHLPILVIANYYAIRDPGTARLAVCLVLIYVTATVSWRLIEKPIRERTLLKSDRTFLLTAGALNGVLLVAGLTLWISNGFPQRFDEADVPRAWNREVPGCERLPFEKVASGGLCSYGPQTEDAPRALVWGDSHAEALLPAYQQLAALYGVRTYFAVKSGCQPLLGVAIVGRDDCERFNNAVVAAIERLNPRLLILNAHWIDKDLVPEGNLALPSGISTFRSALEQTVKQVRTQQRSICTVLDVPSFKYDVPRSLVMARVLGVSSDFLRLSRTDALQQSAGPEQDIRKLEQEHLFRTVDPKDVLCRSGWCVFRSNGTVLYGDSHHLATMGALSVVSAIDGCFRTASRDNLNIQVKAANDSLFTP